MDSLDEKLNIKLVILEKPVDNNLEKKTLEKQPLVKEKIRASPLKTCAQRQRQFKMFKYK